MKGKLTLAAALAAFSVFAGTASANTGSGTALYPWGSGCDFCTVYVYNLSTNSQGSTLTNGSGVYTFSGLNNSNYYEFRLATCKAHSWIDSGWSQTVPGYTINLPTLYGRAAGGC